MAFDPRALGIVDMSDPNFVYGRSATAKASPFRGMIVHHTADKPIENLVNYGKTVDAARGGAFGYHFYIGKDGRIIQGAPLDKRTNHIKPPGHSARKGGGDLSNANAIGISLVGAEKGATPQQKAAAEKLGRALMTEYGIGPEFIFGHGEIQGDRQHTEGADLVGILRGDPNVVRVADAGGATDTGRREALMQEAIRRGLIKEGGQDTSRREALRQEAIRRGLIPAEGDAARIQEKAAVESAVGQVLGEPKIGGTADPVQDPSVSGVRMTAEPDAVVSPTDLLRASPPGMIVAEIRRYLPEKLQNAFDQMVKGSSFNWSDEMTGAANAALSGTEGETFGEEYRRFTDAERARAEQFRETDPALAIGSEVTGALATAPLFGAGVGATAGTAARVAAGAGEGAVAGALAGSGDAKKGERLEGGLTGAAGGAVLGAALSRFGIGVERFLNKRSALANVTKPEDLRKVAGEMIEAAEKTGLTYRPDKAALLAEDLVDTMRAEAFTKGVDDVARAAYKEIVKNIDDGVPVTLKQIAKWENMAFRAMIKAKKTEGGESSSRHLGILVDKLRGFADDEGNMILAATSEDGLRAAITGQGGSAARALRGEGAKMWGRWRRWDRLSKILENAKLDARGNKVSDLEGSIRQAFKAFYKKESNLTGFSVAERKIIRDIAYRGIDDKALQQLAKLSPEGSGLMLFLQLGGVATGSGAVTVPSAIAGFGAKRLADYRATRQVKTVLAQVLDGKPITKETLDAMTNAERLQLARFFLRGTASRYGDDTGEALRIPEATGKTP